MGRKACTASTPKRVDSELLLKALPPWQDKSGSTTAIPSIVGSPRSSTIRRRPRSSLSGAFVTSTAPHSQPGWAPTLSRTRKRLRARFSCPSYHNAKHEQFLSLNKQAAEIADRGTKSGETGDEYVRITVLLATVLLITAIGQRFHFKTVRIVFMILACLLLCLPVLRLLMLPRI